MTGITSKHLIESQIPQHIRDSSPLFTKFLQYYYEFVETSKIVDIIQDVLRYSDSDTADIEFIKNFFEEFRSLPKALATNERFVAKYVYDLYKTKGSESAIKLLFKIVYGNEIDVSYPRDKILRTSDGRWVQESFVVLDFAVDVPLAFFTQYAVLTVDGIEGNVSVTRMSQLTARKVVVYFKTVDLIFGVITNGMSISLSTSGQTIVGTTTNAVSGVSVSSSTGWRVGQIITIPGTYKNTILRVTAVDSNGAIKNTQTTTGVVKPGYTIVEYGVGVTTTPVTITSGTSVATISISQKPYVVRDGYYSDNIGIISYPDIRLQDSFLYQNYSYVVESDIDINTFKDVIKLVHPVGTKYFSKISKTSVIDITDDITGSYTISIPFLLVNDYITATDSTTVFKGSFVSLTDNVSVTDRIRVNDTTYVNVTHEGTVSTASASDQVTLVTKVKYLTDSVSSTDGTPTQQSIQYFAEDYASEIYVYDETVISIT